MSTVKLFCSAAIMIACFAVIYPRFMHPLVLRVLGLNDPPKQTHGYGPRGSDSFPPGGPRNGHPMAEEMRKPMRGPHPGMRHPSDINSRQHGSQGSGKGMMGVVLPMYAVGIVLYLIYTLYKVFNKSKGQSGWNPQSQQHRIQKGISQTHDRMGFPTDFDNSGSNNVQDFLHDQQQRKDLEDLLTRADDKNVSVDEMRMLQKRLEETEAQMTKILSAMQCMQRNVENSPTEQIKPQTESTTQNGKGCDTVDNNEEEIDGEMVKDEEDKHDTADGFIPDNEEEENKEVEDENIQNIEYEDNILNSESVDNFQNKEDASQFSEEGEKSEVIPEMEEKELPVRMRNITKSED